MKDSRDLAVDCEANMSAVASSSAAANSSGRNRNANMSLKDLARRVITSRVHLYSTFGDTPFHLVQPVLESCTPQQLWHLEEQSPQYITETDYIWQRHCKRDFAKSFPAMSMEVPARWREIYRAKALEDHQAKMSAAARIKEKYALLKADREASKVQIVSQQAAFRRRKSGVSQLPNLSSPGQKMLMSARKQAKSFSKPHAVSQSRLQRPSAVQVVTSNDVQRRHAATGITSPTTTTTNVSTGGTPHSRERDSSDAPQPSPASPQKKKFQPGGGIQMTTLRRVRSVQ